MSFDLTDYEARRRAEQAAAESRRRAEQAAAEARRRAQDAANRASREAKKAKKKVKKFFSDIRLKTNIEKVGTSASGINIYKFNYIGSSVDYVGAVSYTHLRAHET